MNCKSPTPPMVPLPLLALLLTLFSLPLSGCNGIALPPIPVTLNLLSDVEVSAAAAAGGSAEVNLGAFCDLFTEEDLDAMVRAAAGDLIADLVTITSVELASTNLMATAGTFQPFTTAELTLTVLEPGADALLLGAAADNAGLGTMISLTQNNPVDLLNDLEDGQCGVPTLRLAGANALESGDIRFDVSVSVLVYTTVSAPQS